jgi:cyclopropane fatty-acyl-phospholipid synthase-like methyltransferase
MRKAMGTGWLIHKEVEEPAGLGSTRLMEDVMPQPMIRPLEPEKPIQRVQTRWPAERMAAVETLWGPGYLGPGGAEETLRLTKPLGLTNNSTLILLGGGLGGPALTVSHSFRAWVTSLEADPVLRATADERRPVLDLNKRITIQGWERDKPAFKPRSANHALSLEALRGTPPLPFITSLAGALRPQGQVVMTELVADQPAPADDREFGAWCRLEDRLPTLPRVADISGALERQKFDVRVVEDISDRHVRQTLEGWRAAVKAMEAGVRPAAAAAASFVNEAELWLLRLRLMRRLDLRLVRWHALSP